MTQDIIVGIRPEDLEDASLAPEEKKGATIATTCTLTEALGSEIIVHFELDALADAGDPDGRRPRRARSGRPLRSASRVTIGDAMEIAINTGNLHFFDPQSRTAIW